jgi:hypothetical protein
MPCPFYTLTVLAWFIGSLLGAQTSTAQPATTQPVAAEPATVQSKTWNADLPRVRPLPIPGELDEAAPYATPYATPYVPAPPGAVRVVPTRQASIGAQSPALQRFPGQEHRSTRAAQAHISTGPPPADVASLARARQDAERSHLWRVAVWGTLNAAGGLALVLGTGRTEQPAYWGFGAQSGLWGAVNIGIAAAGLAAGGDVSTGYGPALSAERTYHDILLFNLGLNVAYSAVGTTLLLVSYRGVDSARSLRGHGSSLIMQGAGLIVLDTIAFLGSRTRLAGLLDMAGTVSARALPTGIAVSIAL